VSYFKVLSKHLPGLTEQNHEKNSVRITGLQVEIRTREMPNITGFLMAIKIRSTTSFQGEVKPSVPCREIFRHVKEPYEYERDTL
jgi:hypothetical protein